MFDYDQRRALASTLACVLGVLSCSSWCVEKLHTALALAAVLRAKHSGNITCDQPLQEEGKCPMFRDDASTISMGFWCPSGHRPGEAMPITCRQAKASTRTLYASLWHCSSVSRTFGSTPRSPRHSQAMFERLPLLRESHAEMRSRAAVACECLFGDPPA
jgi:hypothetical protein